MKTRLTLRPGQNGTKKLQKKYGDRLLVVRYRYDPERRRRLKTVELIEEELSWDPGPPPTRPPNTIVLVRIAWGEIELANQVRQVEGRWLRDKKLWAVRYDAVRALGLESRISE